MLGAFSKAFFHTLSKSGTLKRLASRYGMSGTRGFARRFIAGETLPEARGRLTATLGRAA